MSTIVIAHTFCASRDIQVSYGCWLLIQGYFLRGFKTKRGKRNSASALGIQKNIVGNHAFFKDN